MNSLIVGSAAALLGIWVVEAVLFYLSYRNTPAHAADPDAHSSFRPPL